jgi:hypothetical protein
MYLREGWWWPIPLTHPQKSVGTQINPYYLSSPEGEEIFYILKTVHAKGFKCLVYANQKRKKLFAYKE